MTADFDLKDTDFWPALGLDLDAEALYVTLFASSDLTVPGLAGQLGWQADRLHSARTQLLTSRLIRAVDDQLLPLDPRLALTTRARLRQAVLDRAGRFAEELNAQVAIAKRQADPDSVVEILRDPREVFGQLLHLLHHSREQVRGTVAPPFVSADDNAVEEAELELLHRGVEFRSIYDQSVLDRASLVSDLTRIVSAGESARIHPDVQTKMLIVDGENALLPLAGTPSDPSPATAFIRGRAAVRPYVQLFELLWTQALPYRDEPVPADRRNLDDTDRDILRLMANGIGDDAIAETLAISTRTFRRRMSHIHTVYRARTRYQLATLITKNTV